MPPCNRIIAANATPCQIKGLRVLECKSIDKASYFIQNAVKYKTIMI